jgi:hypothetical protein
MVTPRTVFAHANPIDGDNPAKAEHTIVVEGNLISEIRPDPSVELRPTDLVYDLLASPSCLV